MCGLFYVIDYFFNESAIVSQLMLLVGNGAMLRTQDRRECLFVSVSSWEYYLLSRVFHLSFEPEDSRPICFLK